MCPTVEKIHDTHDNRSPCGEGYPRRRRESRHAHHLHPWATQLTRADKAVASPEQLPSARAIEIRSNVRDRHLRASGHICGCDEVDGRIGEAADDLGISLGRNYAHQADTAATAEPHLAFTLSSPMINRVRTQLECILNTIFIDGTCPGKDLSLIHI